MAEFIPAILIVGIMYGCVSASIIFIEDGSLGEAVAGFVIGFVLGCLVAMLVVGMTT